MKVIPYTQEKLDILYLLYVECMEEENTRFESNLAILSKNDFDDFLQKNTTIKVLLLQWEKEEIIWYCQYSDFFRLWEKHIFIDDLFVIPKCRNLWGGSLLMQSVFQWEKEVYVFVDIHNEKAIQFYIRNWWKLIENSEDQNYMMKFTSSIQ